MLDYLFILLLIPISIASNLNGITDLHFVNNRRLVPLSCPCEDTSLCQPIPPTKGKTRLAYSRVAANWKYFDFTKITEIAMFYDISDMDPQMICTAHKNNVQLHLAGFFNHNTFLNATLKEKWIQDTFDLIKDNFLDGINIDYEEGRSSAWEPSLVKFVAEISSKLKSMNPNYQLTYCSPSWSLEINEYTTAIPKVVDYLMLMDYDQSWNNPQHCYASANQQLQVTISGIAGILNLGVPPSKIVIGMPWYGYLYSCVNITNGKCYYDNCTIREGRQVDPTGIYQQYITNSTYTVENGWDDATLTPYLTIVHNGKDSQTTKQQYWYDNGDSLTKKANIYRSYDVRGISAFHVDCVNYTIPGMQEMVKGLWDSFTVFED